MISDSNFYIVSDTPVEVASQLISSLLMPFCIPQILDFPAREYPFLRLKSRAFHRIVVRDTHYA